MKHKPLVQTRLTDEQYVWVVEQAKDDNRSVASWVRSKILAEFRLRETVNGERK